MYPVVFIAGRAVGTYALCGVVGFLVCGAVASGMGRKNGTAFEDIILLMLASAVGLTVGGHILYGLTNLGDLISAISDKQNIAFSDVISAVTQCFGGSVFYGGFIGGSLALYIYTAFSKSVKRRIVFDIWAACTPLFHFFGRIGCFMGGCCYGIECRFGFITFGNTIVPGINGVRRFPVSLLEATCNLLIFAVIFCLFYKGIFKGRLIYIYVLLYAPIRFITEFLRGDAIRGFFWGLSTSQWISIILFVAASVLLTKAVSRKHTPAEELRKTER